MNKIKCTFCGDVIESKFRHDFVAHTCPDMQKDWESRGNTSLAMIACDGGNDYGRRVFSHRSYFEEIY